MAWNRNRRLLTTGHIGEFVGVNFRTVVGWIKGGYLKAHQLPGRGDHRVKIGDFLDFLKGNHMPIPSELMNTSNRVLIVEDDMAAAEAIETPLREYFETMVARTPFAAGKLATAFSPAVIIIDPEMKDLGGLDLVRTLSNEPNLSRSKVLVASERSLEQLEPAMAAGAWAVISKPFTDSALIAAVAHLCQQT